MFAWLGESDHHLAGGRRPTHTQRHCNPSHVCTYNAIRLALSNVYPMASRCISLCAIVSTCSMFIHESVKCNYSRCLPGSFGIVCSFRASRYWNIVNALEFTSIYSFNVNTNRILCSSEGNKICPYYLLHYLFLLCIFSHGIHFYQSFFLFSIFLSCLNCYSHYRR